MRFTRHTMELKRKKNVVSRHKCILFGGNGLFLVNICFWFPFLAFAKNNFTTFDGHLRLQKKTLDAYSNKPRTDNKASKKQLPSHISYKVQPNDLQRIEYSVDSRNISLRKLRRSYFRLRALVSHFFCQCHKHEKATME